ncbi:YvrJ family protein [Alkalicoccus luteus]|uniref:YvrJ family protein n=1 Tax=Alkalicoccus luteus TaxID=1237094 RepID=A0A969PQ21_9BACI|nr:YvrJ family protein [Alkalicoccus luteus]NJP36884.1 YvrJ family protein [Alkalicoccus luteus]
MTEWTIFAENVGLPGLIVIYILARFERKLDRLTKEVRRQGLSNKTK